MTAARQQPIFICTYRDGTKRSGTYARTLEWFNEAKKTDNPCVVTTAYTGN
jgi:hypothetical protein